VARDAPAVAQDHNGNVFSLGGWNGREALSSVERNANVGGGVGWSKFPRMARRRCFLGAACDSSGRLLAAGGGSSLFRGAIVRRYAAVLLRACCFQPWRRELCASSPTFPPSACPPCACAIGRVCLTAAAPPPPPATADLQQHRVVRRDGAVGLAPTSGRRA
jgi:hypothetical protein